MDAFGLQKAAIAFKEFFLVVQFVLDLTDDQVETILGGDVEVGRKNGCIAHAVDALARFDFDHFDFIDFISKKLNTVAVVYVRQIDVDGIAAHAEGGAFEFNFGARIQTLHQFVQKCIARNDLPFLNADDPRFVIFRVTHTVNAGNRSHDDDVAPAREQVGGSPQAQFIHLFVDL